MDAPRGNSSVVAVIIAVVVAAGFLEFWARQNYQAVQERSVARHAQEMAAVRESLRVRVALDSVHLQAFADSIRRLRGDSLALATAFRATAARIRARTLPGRVDTLLVPSPVHGPLVAVSGDDLFAAIVSDSALSVALDSSRGALEACLRDRDFLRGALEAAPPRSSRWGAFGAGFAAGCGTCAAVTATACVLAP